MSSDYSSAARRYKAMLRIAAAILAGADPVVITDDTELIADARAEAQRITDMAEPD